MSDLRKAVIKLAHDNPELRKDLLPLLSKTAAREHKMLAELAGELAQSCTEIAGYARKAARNDRAAVARVDNFANEAHVYEAQCKLFLRFLKDAAGKG